MMPDIFPAADLCVPALMLSTFLIRRDML